MNERQKSQYVAFMANFIKLLYEENMPRAYAQEAAISVASCLFAVIFDLPPRDDITEVENFTGPVIRAAMDSYYGIHATLQC